MLDPSPLKSNSLINFIWSGEGLTVTWREFGIRERNFCSTRRWILRGWERMRICRRIRSPQFVPIRRRRHRQLLIIITGPTFGIRFIALHGFCPLRSPSVKWGWIIIVRVRVTVREFGSLALRKRKRNVQEPISAQQKSMAHYLQELIWELVVH